MTTTTAAANNPTLPAPLNQNHPKTQADWQQILNQLQTWQNVLGIIVPPMQQTAAEIAAGVTPVNYAYAPGDVRRYGAKGDGVTDDTVAFQSAIFSGAPIVQLQANTTYLASALAATPGNGITLTAPVLIQGGGFSTVIKCHTQNISGTNYSCNIFTSTAAVDSITFRDLTLDGGCANNNAGASSEYALVKITNTSKVTFERVKLTHYCGGWGGTVKAQSQSFWQAITIQNYDRCVFRDCLWQDNYYEMASLWVGPTSDGELLVEGCAEINTLATPTSHTAFDVSGGHAIFKNNFFRNTGPDSQISTQVCRSVIATGNTFLSMQPGSAAQFNVGQDTFPFNSDVLIENNYFLNANQTAISLGQGSSQIIRGNVIDTPTNYGIKITAGVTNFTTFSVEYPTSEGWASPVASGSNSILIEGNIINAVGNGGALPCGIWLHTVNSNAGYWFKDVQIRGNTITAGSAPNNTQYAIRLDDCQDLIVRDNWLQYVLNGLYFETLIQNALIEGNTFNGIPPSTNNDILWVGAPTSSNVSIRRNRWNQWPVGPNALINVFAGTVTGLEVIDNRNMHPTLPVQGPANTAYVQYQSYPGLRTTTAAPSTGDFGIGDRVSNVPTTAQPIEYVCNAAGSFGSALTCTATGTAPNTFFTCSAIGQLHVGQRVQVNGAGVAAANLQCIVTYITGSTFYTDQVISTSVSGAAMSLVAPSFVKSGNYT